MFLYQTQFFTLTVNSWIKLNSRTPPQPLQAVKLSALSANRPTNYTVEWLKDVILGNPATTTWISNWNNHTILWKLRPRLSLITWIFWKQYRASAKTSVNIRHAFWSLGVIHHISNIKCYKKEKYTSSIYRESFICIGVCVQLMNLSPIFSLLALSPPPL